MSLMVLMFFVDKTSLELVCLKKNFKKNGLLKKFHVREKKYLFQNKFCVGL